MNLVTEGSGAPRRLEGQTHTCVFLVYGASCQAGVQSHSVQPLCVHHWFGTTSSYSWVYIWSARPSCLALERQDACRAFSRACANTGNRMAARIAMIAMTTRSSIKVKARRLLCLIPVPSRTAGTAPGKDEYEVTIRRERARLLPCLITGIGAAP